MLPKMFTNWFVVYYLFKLTWQITPICPSFIGDVNQCLTCSGSYFQRDPTAKVFPETDCILKNSESYVSKILIMSPATVCNAECRSQFSAVYSSLHLGLKAESLIASKYLTSEIEVYLSKGDHVLFLGMNEDSMSGIYFRRVNASIIIKPLLCENGNLVDLCVPKGNKSKIKLKSNNVFLFIGRRLEISDILFSALDQHYQNPSSPCTTSESEDCCATEDAVYSSDDPMCSLTNFKIDFENRAVRNWGLFNFENFINDPFPQRIQFSLENSEFINFFLINQKQGFISIFTVMWSSRVEVNFSKCTFSDSFYLKSLIYFENSLEEAKLDPWFANLAEGALLFFYNNAIALRNSLMIFNTSFLSYNTPRITDNRKLLDKSFFIVDVSTTDFMFSDVVFNELHAQDLENQAIVSVTSPVSPQSQANCFLIHNLLVQNTLNMIFFSGNNAGCIKIINASIQQSIFQQSHALIIKSTNFTLANASFSDLLMSQSSYLLNVALSNILVQNVNVSKSKNPRLYLESSKIQIISLSLDQVMFSFFLFEIRKSDFFLENSSLIGLSVLEKQQDIVIFQQERNSVFKNVLFKDISAPTLKFFDKTNNTSFLNCTFYGIYDVDNFIAAESIYLTYLLQDSSIILCAFANFYYSLNGNRFTVQPRMYLYGITWKNCTVRVGYFSAFSNVLLELKDSEIRDMVAVKKDKFVRFFYIGRNSSFLMKNSKVIDCGYDFEPVLNEYAYNYLILLGQFISSYFNISNSIFTTAKPLSLKTGYVALNRLTTGVASIINCSFIVSSYDSYSHNGVTFTTTNEIEFINNTLINIRCPADRISVVHEWGAVFLYGEETGKFYKNKKKANISGNYFQNCTCRGGAGLTVVNYHNLNIEKNVFKNNSAWFQIGSLGIWSSTKVILRENLIFNSSSPMFGAIKIENVLDITISNLTVESTSSLSTAVIYVVNVLDIELSNFITNAIETFSNGGLIYVGNSYITVYSSKFSNIRTNLSGGVFFIDIYSNLVLNDCVISNVEAFSGGVLAVFIGTDIFISNLTILNVSSKSNGAAFLFEQFFQAQISNVSIENATALVNGIITFESTDEAFQLSIINILCTRNKALAGSCIYIDSITNLTITGIIAKECTGVFIKIISEVKIWAYIKDIIGRNNKGDDLLSFESIYLALEDLFLDNNFAEKSLINLNKIPNGNIKSLTFLGRASLKSDNFFTAIKLDQSSIEIKDLTFDYIQSNTQSTVLYCLNSKLMITMAEITGSVSLQNTGAFLFIDTFVEASEIHFLYNYGVCIKGTGLGGTFKKINMIFNSAVDMLQSAHFDYYSSTNTSIVLSLDSVNSNQQSNGISLKIKNFGTVYIVNSLFKSSAQENSSLLQEIKGIEAINTLSIKILNSIFNSLKTAGRGAALYALDNIGSADWDFSSVYIVNSSFNSCSSIKGAGALFISNKRNVLIENNSFTKNLAKSEEILDLSEFEGVGAVGIILCYPSSGYTVICKTSLLDNFFEDNFAYYHSPLFYVNSTTIIVHSIYLNNSDQINFTKTITSYPPDLKMLFPGEYLGQNYFRLDLEVKLGILSFLEMQLSEKINVLDLRSGEPFNMTFFITDSQDKVLVFDDFSYGSIDVAGPFKYQIKIENGVAKAEKGWFNFSNTRIFGWPDSTVLFEFSFKIPKYTILNPDPIILKRSIYIHFRPCLIGEVILYDLRCLECPYNSYSNVDPMIIIKNVELESVLFVPVMKCSPCLNRAFCPGGWAIFPLEGNWRANKDSEKIIDCLIPQACIGYDLKKSINENLNGVCKEGHYGNLCHDCIKDFGKLSNNFTCGKCEDVLKGAFVRLLLAVLMIISYAIFGSYLYSLQREKKEGYLFVYLRIGISFSQITSLLTYIKIEWPMIRLNQFQNMSSNSLSLTSEDVLLNDCIIKVSSLGNREIYALKMVITILLPLILFALSSLAWIFFIMVIRRRKLDKPTLKDFYIKIFASLIISVFLFHPLIIKNSFNMLNCFVLDSSVSTEEFLFAYPNFKCWDSFHLKVIILVVLPGIFIWGLGFPLVLLYLLIKQRLFRVATTKKSKKEKGFEEEENLESANKSRTGMAAPEGMWAFKMQPVFKKKDYEANQLESHRKSGKIQKLKKLILKSNLFQFLHHGYKEQYCFWECLIFLKKFVLSMFINFNQIIGFEMVNLLILSVLSIHLYLHVTKRPYLVKSLNYLEFMCLVGSITIFVSVILLQANINILSQYFFGSLIFASYCVCLVYTVYHIGMSLRRMDLINKFNKIKASIKTKAVKIR